MSTMVESRKRHLPFEQIRDITNLNEAGLGAKMIFGKGVQLKTQKIFLTLIFSTITFLLIGCGNNTVISPTPDEEKQPLGNDLSFTISSDKQIYSLNEEIFITMTLKNDGDKSLIVNNLLISDGSPRPLGVVAFTIFSPTGDLLFFYKFIDYTPSCATFVLLSANESTSRINTITKDYDFDQIGIYTISAEYNNLLDSPDGREAWKGLLESNTITIEVVP